METGFPKDSNTWCFPTVELKAEFLDSIHEQPERIVFLVLRQLLWDATTFQGDKDSLLGLVSVMKDRSANGNKHSRLLSNRILRGLDYAHRGIPPWDGIHWIVGLLPHDPRRGLYALQTYIEVHQQFLPDGRLSGLWDASDVIRARYLLGGLWSESGVELLHGVHHRDFEVLVWKLFEARGFESTLGPGVQDGGVDVYLKSQAPGRLEHVAIQCKAPTKNRTSVTAVRQLRGVLANKSANRGILVSTRGFTKNAREEASQGAPIELIDGPTLCGMMAETYGETWSYALNSILS